MISQSKGALGDVNVSATEMTRTLKHSCPALRTTRGESSQASLNTDTPRRRIFNHGVKGQPYIITALKSAFLTQQNYLYKVLNTYYHAPRLVADCNVLLNFNKTIELGAVCKFQCPSPHTRDRRRPSCDDSSRGKEK